MSWIKEDQLGCNNKKKGRAPVRPSWDWFRSSVREACVRNDSRNVAARAVPRQFFGTVA